MSFQDLPTDILLCIYSRLPIGTISTLRQVCKNWRDSFLSPAATRELLRRRNESSVPCSYMFYERRSGDLHLLDDFENEAVAVKLNLWSNAETNRVIASYDGFIVYYSKDDERMYVCNPITGDRVGVPSNVGWKPIPYYEGYGLGIDTTANEFKLLMVSESMSGETGRSVCTCHVHTLGTDSWRPVGDLDNRIYFRCKCRPVFHKGSLYFTVVDNDSNKIIIVALELHTEKLRVVPGPPSTMSTRCLSKYYCDLVKFGERLCCKMERYLREEAIWREIWVLEDEKKGCWCEKRFVLPSVKSLPLYGMWKNGTILGKSNDQLGYCHPGNGRFTEIKKPGRDCLLLRSFVPSLVSPKVLCTGEQQDTEEEEKEEEEEKFLKKKKKTTVLGH